MRTLSFIILILASSNAEDKRREEIKKKFEDWRFKDFMQRFDPRTVWEKVERLQASGKSNESFLELMIKHLDETDDFLKLKVHKIGPPPPGKKMMSIKEMINETRRYRPLPGLNPYSRDKFDLRVRLYELMRQAIYQARNEMVIMQIMRDKFRDSSLYKMGFLMSKTDNAVKTFFKVSVRSFRLCGMTRVRIVDRHYLYDLLVSQEHMLHLLFNAQLLIELVERNNRNCTLMLKTVNENRNEAWKFED